MLLLGLAHARPMGSSTWFWDVFESRGPRRSTGLEHLWLDEVESLRGGRVQGRTRRDAEDAFERAWHPPVPLAEKGDERWDEE